MKNNNIGLALDLLDVMDQIFDELCCQLHDLRDELKLKENVRIGTMDVQIEKGFKLTNEISKLLDQWPLINDAP